MQISYNFYNFCNFLGRNSMGLVASRLWSGPGPSDLAPMKISPRKLQKL
jgi:hypothetical protein